MNIGLFDIKKSYLNETAKGIEHKIQEKSKENRIIKYKQIRIEFCYTWVGIHKVCLGYAYAFAMFLFRRASRTAATYKMEREAVNYYHKALHLGCCSSPRSASDHITVLKIDGAILFPCIFSKRSVQKEI